jgi:putative phosphoesterase
MRIAILSDIHDNLWNLAPAIAAIQDADCLLCCGDLCSPFVIDELAKFPKDVHVVFGNNDADLFRITAKTMRIENVHAQGEIFRSVFDGRRFHINHFDYLARDIATSGNYDVVCFGHNHEFEIAHEGPCLLINPGPVMGAKFSSGHWEDVAPTFVVYDTGTNQVTRFEINAGSRSVRK